MRPSRLSAAAALRALAGTLVCLLAACRPAEIAPAGQRPEQVLQAPAGPRPADCRDLTPERPYGLVHQLAAARQLMGTAFEIRVATADPAAGCAAANAALDEVARLEALFTEFRPESDVSAINRAAGVSPVDVDPEVLGLLLQATRVAEITGGAFDITFAACGRLWSIRERRVPEPAALAACLERVGFRDLKLDVPRSRAFLAHEGMRIGLGGVAKGYGVDRAADLLRARGIDRFAVDGGGDLRVQGEDVDGPWIVRIAHPRRPDEAYDTIRLDRGAIVTSGDYFRYFESGGVRYHHILDPATGQPARRSMAVTVIAPTATEADGLATGLFVLGPERGLAVVAGLRGVEALFFGPDGAVSASPGFPRGAASPLPGTHRLYSRIDR